MIEPTPRVVFSPAMSRPLSTALLLVWLVWGPAAEPRAAPATADGPATAALALPPTGFLAGWAAGDLTPDRPVLIQGQHNRRVSRGVLDPITCTVLVVEARRDGRSVDQAVFVSCDFCIPSPPLLDELAKRHDAMRRAAPGLDPAKIVLNATHTHAGPVCEDGWYETLPDVMTPAEYRSFAAERIAAAVVTAWNSRSPSATSWALSYATVAHNRRNVAFDAATGLPRGGTTRMYGSTAVPTFDSIEGGADTAVSLVFFWKPDGTLSGLVVNIPCPAQETETIEQLSADFWHEVRLELKRRLGEAVFVLPQCAAGGDCTSHLIWRKRAEQEMLRRRGRSGREEIARRIANAIEDVMPVAREGLSSEPRFEHAIRTLDLPMQLVTPADRDRCSAEVERWAKAPGGFTRAAWHRDVIRRYDEQQSTMARGGRPTVPVTVHAIRLGEVAFITNTFEMFGDYGVRLQARSPATLTCVVQLAGRGTPGTYLPTARAVEGGGYSAVIESNWVGPAGGRLLVDESVRMLEGLWAAPPTPAVSSARPPGIDIQAAAVAPSETITLFDGKQVDDLRHFYTWLGAKGYDDPNRVFSVVDRIDGAPAIRISGQDWGGLVTRRNFRDYRLVLECRWGTVTWGGRRDKALNSGILFHCQGEDGNNSPAFTSPWVRSVEYEIQEGRMGAVVLVGGHDRGVADVIRPVLTMRTKSDKVWDPDGTPEKFNDGFLFQSTYDRGWKDVLGVRGKLDPDASVGGWNRVEILARGGDIVYFLNGTKILEASECTLTEGRVMFQSEGAETFLRLVELHPLDDSRNQPPRRGP
jgi:hypothetical protein